MSSALCAMVGSRHQHRVGDQRDDALGNRDRGDEIAAAGNHHRGPGELRHLGDQVIGLGLESGRSAAAFSRIATAGSSGRPIGLSGVVEFAESDATDQVHLETVRHRAGDQLCRSAQRTPQLRAAAQQQIELTLEQRCAAVAVDHAATCAPDGVITPAATSLRTLGASAAVSGLSPSSSTPRMASRTAAMSCRDSSGESRIIACTRPGWRTPTPAAM